MAFASDTFTDTTDVVLTSHVGELGATWAMVPDGSASDNGQISADNRLKMTAGYAAYYASGAPATAEYDVEGDLYVASAGEFANGLIGRASVAATTYYFFDHYSTANQWRLFKVVAGSFTELGTFGQTLADDTTYAIKLEIRDAAKKCYVNGVERISSADNAITATGFAGVRPYGAGSDTTGLHIDNFIATDVGGPPPPTTAPKLRVNQSNMRLA